MPFIQVFLTATNSLAWTSVLTTILIILTIYGPIANMATASRQMFAFPHDDGLPFSKFLAGVIKPRSWTEKSLLTCLLGSTRLGPASLGVGALIFSCIVSILCTQQTMV